MNTYLIPEMNIDKLRKKMTQIERKCKKYDAEFQYEEIGEKFEEVKGLGIVRFIEVTVHGYTRIDGWEIIAKLEKVDDNLNHIIVMGSRPVPEHYYGCKLECDHCNFKRHRTKTYVVYNVNTDEYRQVGVGCLKDYTGISAEWAAVLACIIRDIEDDYTIIHDDDYGVPYIELQTVLKYAYDYIKNLGFHKSDENDATKYDIEDALRVDGILRGGNDKLHDIVNKYRNLYDFNIVSDEVIEYVDACIHYYKNLTNDEVDNEYINKLHTIAKQGYVTITELGIVASMIPAYQRHLDYIKQQQLLADMRCNGTHIGEVGDKVELKFVSIKFVCGWETQYGYTRRYQFITSNNDVIMWDASKGIDYPNDGDVSGKIVGKVKRHDIYDGVNQTWLTRCKVTLDTGV